MAATVKRGPGRPRKEVKMGIEDITAQEPNAPSVEASAPAPALKPVSAPKTREIKLLRAYWPKEGQRSAAGETISVDQEEALRLIEAGVAVRA